MAMPRWSDIDTVFAPLPFYQVLRSIFGGVSRTVNTIGIDRFRQPSVIQYASGNADRWLSINSRGVENHLFIRTGRDVGSLYLQTELSIGCFTFIFAGCQLEWFLLSHCDKYKILTDDILTDDIGLSSRGTLRALYTPSTGSKLRFEPRSLRSSFYRELTMLERLPVGAPYEFNSNLLFRLVGVMIRQKLEELCGHTNEQLR